MRPGAGTPLSRPGAFLLCLVPTLLFGTALALWLQPQPHSDWGYYWDAAGRFRAYERGGIGLWMLAIPKALGLSPVAAALCLNLPAAAAALWMAWRADAGGRRGLWLATAAYLVLLVPYFGIVQLDVLATTLLGAGMWLGTFAATRPGGRVAFGGAVLLVMAGVSTRPQFALVLWTLLLLVALPWLLSRGRGHAVSGLLTVLALGSVLGFGLDYGLRALGDRDESIRTSSAVTLYAGLLVSGQDIGCGYWSVEAARAARKDRRKSLHRVMVERLSAQPVSHWIGVIRCKLPEIVRPPPFATYWLVETPSVRAGIEADPRREEINATYYRILGYERLLYAWLTLAILAMAALTAAVLVHRRSVLEGLLPIAWILSFWLVHLVFEIQGRYFLGMYLLTPLLCMLVLSLAARRPGDTAGQAPVSAQKAG